MLPTGNLVPMVFRPFDQPSAFTGNSQSRRPPKITRFAHRGLSLHHTENTLEAFAAAQTAGAHWLETDVHASRDGVIFVFHDETLNRVAHCSGEIAQLSAAQIQAIELPHGEKIPTLQETFLAFPKMGFNIDLKNERAAREIGNVLARTGAWGRTRLVSFSESRLKIARQEVGKYGALGRDVRWGATSRAVYAFFCVHILPPLPGGYLRGSCALWWESSMLYKYLPRANYGG